METKEPVMVVVLVESAKLRWFVSAIGRDGTFAPLVRSEKGDLAAYQEVSFDDQVSFLRHRFCGVLQRGCDRLWPCGKKACQFVFVFDGPLPNTTLELLPRVADHFVEWMLNPPVVVYTSQGGFSGASSPQVERLCGTIDRTLEEVLRTSLVPLFRTPEDTWEISQRKGTWRPAAETAAH